MRSTSVAVATLAAAALIGTLSSAAPPPQGTAPGTKVVVYKSPSCGCCKKWVDHLQANGFSVEVHDVPDVSPMKEELGVPKSLTSCHTAVIGKYVIEGHVPAGDIQRLVKEQPAVVGLAAPGMPAGAPGMDSGDEPYQVLSFDAKGKTAVWASH
jgi:hypothetical protein